MLSKEAVREFKKIYKRKEGKELSNKEAFELATNLILTFEAIYRPIPQKDKKKSKRLKNKDLKL